MEGRGEGWALMPALPPLFYENGASWTSLISQSLNSRYHGLYHPEYCFILIFPHGLANPTSWLSAQILYPLKTFWESPNHTLYFGQIPRSRECPFRPSGKLDLSIKRSRNFLNSFFNGLQKWLSNLSFRIIPSWVVLVPLNERNELYNVVMSFDWYGKLTLIYKLCFLILSFKNLQC